MLLLRNLDVLVGLRLVPNRIWLFFWKIRCPLGAKIYIDRDIRFAPAGGYNSYEGKITLFMKGVEDVEMIEEILNHEILHSICRKIAGDKARQNLDNVQIWSKDGKHILFKKVDEA